MSRTVGSRDLRKRKTRRDKKHKYRKNRMGNLVRYVPKRKKTDPLRVWFWERKNMSKEGFMRFPRRLRPFVDKKVKVFVGRPILVQAWQLSNPEAIGQLAIETVSYPGSFLLMMPTHSKNSYGCSYKKKANVKIVDTEEGLKAFVTNTSKLSHYWFYQKQ